MAAEMVRRFPWLARRASLPPASAGPGEGWFDPPSLATLFRKAAAAARRRIVHDRVTGIEVRRPHRDGAAGERRNHRLPQPRQRGGALGRRAGGLAGVQLPVEPRKRYVYVIDCREASDALHRAPLTVDPPACGSGPRAGCSCAASPRGKRGAAGRRSRRTSTTSSSRARCGRSSPRACRLRERQGGQRLGRLLRLQHARPERGHRSAPEIAQFLFRQRLFRTRRAAGRGRGRAIAELVVHGAFQTST